jgi:inner membrane protein
LEFEIMFIGHLPAGYLCTTALLRATGLPPERQRPLLWAGLASSVLPDLDMLYFYLVDRQRHLHHAYWTHLPFFWLCLIGLGALIAWWRGRGWPLLLVVAANLMLHMLLDTLVGGVRWLSPLSDAWLTLVEVPARYQPWVLSFILHWTFGLELLVCLAAGGFYWRRRRG